MRKIAVTLVAMAMWVGATGASAQTATVGATASVTIPGVIAIDVTNTAVAFEAVTESSYGATGTGSVAGLATSVISTRSNIVHRVTIAADAPEMTGTGPGGNTKPASDLQWRTVGGTFDGLSTVAADVVSGLGRGIHNSAAEVEYQMLLNLANDDVGTHTLAFTYTALPN